MRLAMRVAVACKLLMVAVSLGPTFPEPEDGWVFQIGLVNGIGRDSKSGWFDGMRYLPVINVGW